MIASRACVVFVSAALLVGCSAQPPEPIPTVTVVQTLSPAETPAAPRTKDSPIDGFDAFYFCRGEVLEYAVANPTDDTELNTYSDSLVSGADGTYTVQLKGEMGDRSVGAAFCTVSGTLGAPVVEDYQYLP